jgi:formamidopyrimidine-DNA glycosylase
VVELLRTADEGRALGHLGPDVLGPDWDPAEARRRLAADPRRTISDALLDQRVLAGVGNVYRCEICFLRGLHPATEIARVPDLAGVVDLVFRLMDANRGTGRQVTTGDTRRGRERWVYGRARLPCRRCGTPVEKAGAEGGPEEWVTFWCPLCQPG